MKNLLFLIVLIAASFVLQLTGIWWLPALAAIVIGFTMKDQSAIIAFSVGFLGLFLLWGGWSLYSDGVNDGILSGKVGDLFNGLNGTSLIAITAIIGGLLGGLGTLTGKYVKGVLG